MSVAATPPRFSEQLTATFMFSAYIYFKTPITIPDIPRYLLARNYQLSKQNPLFA